MRIALIDGGIERRRCPEINIEKDLVVERSGLVRDRCANDKILTDHGNICAKIINTYSPGVSFCSLQIFEEKSLKTELKRLLAALRWCEEECIPIVHLSAGSTRLSDYKAIKDAINAIVFQGQYIVAAKSNYEEAYTMPAMFSRVFGVCADKRLARDEYRISYSQKVGDVSIYAPARHSVKFPGEEEFESPISGSYAAPVITALLHEKLSRSTYSNYYDVHRDILGEAWAGKANLWPDFLSSPIVFDPDDNLRFPELLNFNPLEIVKEEALLWAKLESFPKHPLLLVLPPAVDKVFLTRLKNISSDRMGIAATSGIPDISDFICPTWDEERAAYILAGSLEYGGESGNIPCVFIKADGGAAFEFTRRLQAALAREGVAAVAASDLPMSYLYGYSFIPKNLNIPRVLKYFAKLYTPDILIVLTNSCKNLREKQPMIGLSCNESDFIILDKHTVSISAHPGEDDFKALLDFLFDYDFDV